MRIIAGTRKGHRIDAPKGRATRPTSDRVRENVFNLVAAVGRGRGRARPLRRLRRDGDRGAVARRRACRLRRVAQRRVPRRSTTTSTSFASPGAQVVCSDVGALPRHGHAHVRPDLLRSAVRRVRRARAAARPLHSAAARRRRPARARDERQDRAELPLEQRTVRRYGAARITLFHR